MFQTAVAADLLPRAGSATGPVAFSEAYTGRRTASPVRSAIRAVGNDQLLISPGALSLHHLVRMWTALSGLFGLPASRTNPLLPDLVAIRETLRAAQLNLAELRDRQGVLDTLKRSALRGAEALVEEYYSLRGDGARLRVVLEPDMGSTLASVSYRYDNQGRMVNQQLHINLKAFTPDTGPNGRNGRPVENDRIIAHEITHVIMGRNLDVRVLPEWFMEGTAEYIAGGAERVSMILRHLSPQALLARVRHPWVGDNSQYGAGYLAVRFLDQITEEAGGLRSIMAELADGRSLDNAIARVTDGALADETEFLAYLVESGAGTTFMRSIDLTGRDPGSIRPGHGPGIVSDTPRRSSQPMRGFQMVWPEAAAVPLFRPIWVADHSLAYLVQKAYNHRTRLL